VSSGDRIVPSVAKSEPEDLRARVLSASIELLLEEGVGGLSMREVARRAGVSHQAPYHHFPDRESILAAIAEEGFELLTKRMTAEIGRAKGDAIDVIERTGVAYVEFALTHPAHFRLMFRPELVDIESHPAVAGKGDGAFGVLRRVVQEAIDAGLPDFGSQDVLTAATWSVAHGLACLILDGPLAMKLPHSAAARAEIVRGVMTTLGAMMRASSKKPHKKK
jgi:AcrR family transcriptional regulator